jgi:hypothetical protein
VFASVLALLIAADVVQSRNMRRAALREAGHHLGVYVGELTRDIHQSGLRERSGLGYVLERFRSEHPQIAAIRVRTAQGQLLAQSGVILRSRSLQQMLSSDRGRLRVSTDWTSSGEIAVTAVAVRLQLARAASSTLLKVSLPNEAELVVVEIAGFLQTRASATVFPIV